MTLLAVPAWRFATHAPGLLLHPLQLLAAAFGLRSLGTAVALAALQAVASWAFSQVVTQVLKLVLETLGLLCFSLRQLATLVAAFGVAWHGRGAASYCLLGIFNCWCLGPVSVLQTPGTLSLSSQHVLAATPDHLSSGAGPQQVSCGTSTLAIDAGHATGRYKRCCVHAAADGSGAAACQAALVFRNHIRGALESVQSRQNRQPPVHRGAKSYLFELAVQARQPAKLPQPFAAGLSMRQLRASRGSITDLAQRLCVLCS